MPSDPWGRRVDSVARTLEIFHDPWTFVVLREAFFGVRRFDDFQRNLDISRNILTKRLKHLVGHGILERILYQQRPNRYEYRLSERGYDMYPIFAALMRWGDRWLAGVDGAPLLLVHERCGKRTTPTVVCDHCHAPLVAREMSYAAGPGAGSRDEGLTAIEPQTPPATGRAQRRSARAAPEA
jgi:DNA-binding HxlR family transcriptional regulator